MISATTQKTGEKIVIGSSEKPKRETQYADREPRDYQASRGRGHNKKRFLSRAHTSQKFDSHKSGQYDSKMSSNLSWIRDSDSMSLELKNAEILSIPKSVIFSLRDRDKVFNDREECINLR